MAWHDGCMCAFVFNSNVGQLNVHSAMNGLRRDFLIPSSCREVLDTISLAHCLCLTTSKEPGLLNTGVNPDIVQMSCLLMDKNADLTSDLCLAQGKSSVGCIFKGIGFTVEEFKGLACDTRVGLAEVLLRPGVALPLRLEILDGLTEVVAKMTVHVQSVHGNVEFVRKQLKAASFVLHRCSYLLNGCAKLTVSPLLLGNSDIAEWNAIGDPCDGGSSNATLVDTLLYPCRCGKISFHRPKRPQDGFRWPMQKLLALRVHDLKNVVMQKLLTGNIHCWGIARVAHEESVDSDSEIDSGDADSETASETVLSLRGSIEVKAKKRSSLLTQTQRFTESSQSYMGCIGLVVALSEVLDALSTEHEFDFANLVSRGVAMGKIRGPEVLESRIPDSRIS